MKTRIIAAVLVILGIAAFVLYSSAYVVEEGTQVIVTQFGKPVEDIQKGLDGSFKKAGEIINGQTSSKRMQDRAREKGGFIQAGPPRAERKEEVRGRERLRKELRRGSEKIKTGRRGRKKL